MLGDTGAIVVFDFVVDAHDKSLGDPVGDSLGNSLGIVKNLGFAPGRNSVMS
jgi:hypothetical protein